MTAVLVVSLVALLVLCLVNAGLARIAAFAAVVYVVIYAGVAAVRIRHLRRIVPFLLLVVSLGAVALLLNLPYYGGLPSPVDIRTLAATHIADIRFENDGYDVNEQLSVDLQAVLDEPVDESPDPFDELPRERAQVVAVMQQRFTADGWVLTALVDGRPTFTRCRMFPLEFDGLQLQRTVKVDLSLPSAAADVRLRADETSKATLSSPPEMVVATKPAMSSPVAEARRREVRTLSLKDEAPLENSRLTELEVVVQRGLLRNAVGKKISELSLSRLAAGLVLGFVALVLAAFKKVISDEYIVPWLKRRFPNRPVPDTG